VLAQRHSPSTFSLATSCKRLVARLVRDRVLHFLVLGAMVFVCTRYLAGPGPVPITITQNQVSRLAENYRLQYGSSPSGPRLQDLVDSWINEEILYREALKLHLDAGDEIVRRRLVQKYEFVLQDLIKPPDPTDAQLRTYYLNHLAQYRQQPRLTFTHVYFSTDLRGEEGARAAAQQLAAELNRKPNTRITDQSDAFFGPYNFSAVTPEELARVFGKEGLSDAILSLDLKRWSAPLRSGFGWHTVYVEARQESRQTTFEDALNEVRRDYLEAARAELNARSLSRLRRDYRIERQ